MSHLVILNLGKGDYDRGCPVVTAQLWLQDDLVPMQVMGSLPAAPELGALYDRWQQLYAALYAHRSWRQTKFTKPPEIDFVSSIRSEPESEFEIEQDETYITDISEAAFKQLCQELHQQLNAWLNVDTFRSIDRHLRTRLSPADDIRLIITAENHPLLRLPWHLWHFLEDYPRAELALSLPEYTRSIKTISATPKSTVNILAILGSCQGINITKDQELLEQLPNTALKLLVEPNLEDLHQQLWHPGWDILFFAGHSSSQGTGRIYVNSTESLTIAQLRLAVKKAIEHGLKLAIFNSCDGLELAWSLADLQIPQVIVMREPVPDRIAQEFLKHFLTTFSSGQSLYLSVREARERLQALETQFPCATWLPVICQNPAELPPKWEDWCRSTPQAPDILPPPHLPLPPSSPSPISPHPPNPLFRRVLLSSLITTGLVLGIRWLGLLQPLELWTFDRLLTLRPQEPPDRRLLIVTIDEADIQAQHPEQRRGSLSDRSLDQLLKRLLQYQPRVIGLDIYRDFPTSPQYPDLRTQLRQNKRLVAICKGSDAQYDPVGVAPPPEMLEARLGFSDFIEDSDGILRRQTLFRDPEPASACTTPYAFSTRLAFRYLEGEKIAPEFTPTGNLKLRNMVFPRLGVQTGGYQGADHRGNRVLLNYRALAPRSIAPQVTLTQVLRGQIRPEAIRDRILLIGVIANSSGDFWLTPYSAKTAEQPSEQVPGVFIQAHMTSQIISAVLDQRPLISAWHWTGEGLWIWAWAVVGGSCAEWGQRLNRQSIASMIALSLLAGLSLLLLMQGIWVPLIPAGMALMLTAGMTNFFKRKL